MNTTTVIQMEKSDLADFFEQVAYKMIVEKFSSREVSTCAAAEVVGKTEQTINAWVRTGKLLPVNPGSSKYKFKLSDLLKMN